MNILVINVSLRPNPPRIFIPIGLGYVVSAMKRGGFEFDLLDLDAHPLSPEATRKFLHTHRYDVVDNGFWKQWSDRVRQKPEDCQTPNRTKRKQQVAKKPGYGQ